MNEPTPKLRVGRSVGRTLYVQVGAKPSEQDVVVGLVDTPQLAEQIVEAVEVVPKVRAENAILREQVRVLQEQLQTAENVGAQVENLFHGYTGWPILVREDSPVVKEARKFRDMRLAS